MSKTASFTTYAKGGFTLKDQKKLARLARKSADNKQVSVVISNHATDFTKEIYAGADELDTIDVARTISHKVGARKRVEEIFALYKHQQAEME